ncbi:hypothetical protein K491DRAFT_677481 [Lophiostoma macrostomum CBS 122681]|uniref:Uncharacterized protein n=1 Tax=Lophiostoma macrostomum CBS 122681 TaxID=1314788 RepID=A0A6A6TBF7_9PLEO|nr:hypothetical protein K491DRAFT_677481 [Lophiostoma macrostomum CBS 122681]
MRYAVPVLYQPTIPGGLWHLLPYTESTSTIILQMSNHFENLYTGQGWPPNGAGTRTPVLGRGRDESSALADNYRGRRRQRSRSSDWGRTQLLPPAPSQSFQTRPMYPQHRPRHQSFEAEDIMGQLQLARQHDMAGFPMPEGPRASDEGQFSARHEDHGRSLSRDVDLRLQRSHSAGYGNPTAEYVGNSSYGMIEAEHQQLRLYPPLASA